MTVGNLASENHTIVDGLFEAIARGVRYQVIYGTRVLRDPAALRMVQACATAYSRASRRSASATWHRTRSSATSSATTSSTSATSSTAT